MTLSLPDLRDRIAAARAMDAPVLLLPDEAEGLAVQLEDAPRCEKCGGTDIRTRHHIGASYWGDARNCALGVRAPAMATRADEHLHRYCETCLFDWTNDVLSTEAS